MTYVEALGREVAQMAPMLNPDAQGRPTPFRRRLADVSAARRNPPARRNHPQTFHVFAGHRGQRGSGPAPAHARPHGGAARNRFQPRLDGRAGFQPEGAGGDSPHPAARNDAAGDGLDARTRLRLHQPRFDLRPAVPDAGIVQRNARHRVADEARPARRVQLRARAVDQAVAENSGTQNPALAGNQTGSAQARHRTAHGGRPIRLYRHGPFREADRRTRRGAAREKAPAEFSGLQHARRLGHLRVRHVAAFRRSPTPTGRTRRNCRNGRPPWTPATCRCTGRIS